MSARAAAVARLAVWIYRVALRLCPRGVRRQYGPDMILTFDALCRDASTRGLLAVSALVAREVWQMAAARRRRPADGAIHLSSLSRPPVTVMVKVLSDIRQGLRSLRHGRGVAWLAIVAFALGIGVTTAVFSLFYGVLLRPLPYPRPEELVVVYDTQPTCPTCPASYPKYIDWTTRNHVFAAMAGSYTPPVVVTGLGEPERVRSAKTTASLLDVFGVAPAHGRWFTEAEDQPGGSKVVVLSDAYWVRRFGAEVQALGRTITIDGTPFQVIGIMPTTFVHRGADLFVPLQRKNDPATRGSHFLQTYARLKRGVTVAQAQTDMVALGRTLAAEFGTNHGIDVASLAQVVVGGLAQPLHVLMGAVSLVLLIACANVANLLLASGLARRRELAVRSALGATRWDLARQLSVESVMLALVGGALGVGLAYWALTTFIQLAGAIVPRTAVVRLDGTVLAFAALVSLATGVVCGLWPVLRLGTRVAQGIRDGDVRAGGACGRRFGNGLVVAEIALAFSLLVGTGLLVKDLVALERRDTGFSTDRLVAFDVSPTGPDYQQDAQVRTFYRELLSRLAAVPGIEQVAATSHLPMYQFGTNGEVHLEGGNPWQPKDAPAVEQRWITPTYFTTMGIALVRGRSFDDRDREGSPRVCLISQRAANLFWPGRNPLGRRVSPDSSGGAWLEVVGVARDVRTFGLASTSPYELYVPIEQEEFGPMTVVLKTRTADPTTVIPAARTVLASIDPTLPLSKAQTLDEVVSASVAVPRLISALTSFFGALAGLLAAVGVYGVMAHNVRRQRRAFGIRLALGANPGRVRRLVVWRGCGLAGLGVAIGAGGALLLTTTLRALLNDVRPTDPTVFGLTAAGIIGLAALAAYLPARQAAQTDLIVILRAE